MSPEGDIMFDALTACETAQLLRKLHSAHQKFDKVTEYLQVNGADVRGPAFHALVGHSLHAQIEMTELCIDVPCKF